MVPLGKKLLIHVCAFTLPIRPSGILLRNHISRSFVTALSQRAVWFTPKRPLLFPVVCESSGTHFGKTKTGGGGAPNKNPLL